MTNNKVYELKCGICGKVIKSLSEKQAEHNFKVHLLIHGLEDIKSNREKQ